MQKIGVVGGGTMGNGIAHTAALTGHEVLLVEVSAPLAERAVGTISKNLQRGVDKGKMSAEEKYAVLGRIRTSTSLEDLADRELIVEAILEQLGAKLELFGNLDRIAPAETILASNTSSISITKLAAATERPEQVIGMHFFNPVPVLKLVEVVRGLQTSDETTAAVVALAEDLGKVPAEARDFPGFVSNRILMPFLNEAAYALLEGVAEPEAIDTIAKLGFAHPMGPLALADLIGLDTCVAIMEVLHEGLGDPRYAPCPLLRQYVAAGRLGRKSGRGFYEYG